jgi:hypothetical protein
MALTTATVVSRTTATVVPRYFFANRSTRNPRVWVQRLVKLTVIHSVREFEMIVSRQVVLLKIVMGHFCYPSAHVQAEMRLNTLK